mgnify:CR=1 FL=1
MTPPAPGLSADRDRCFECGALLYLFPMPLGPACLMCNPEYRRRGDDLAGHVAKALFAIEETCFPRFVRRSMTAWDEATGTADRYRALANTAIKALRDAGYELTPLPPPPEAR